MTILEHPGHAAARARGDLAEYLTDLAGELAFLVRTEGRDTIGAWFAAHHLTDDARITGKTRAFIIALASQIDIDTTTDQRLAWVTWDENGRPLPGVQPAMPPLDTPPAIARRIGRLAAPALPESRRDERIEVYVALRREGHSIPKAAQMLTPPVSSRQAQRWEAKLRDEGRAPWRDDNGQQGGSRAA